MEIEGLWNEQRAANYLGVSRYALQAWRFYRRGPAYLKLGRRVLYRPDDLESFVESRRIDPNHREGDQ